MFNKNTILNGILIGAILPILSVILFEVVYNPVWLVYHRGVPEIVAAAINLIMLRVFASKKQDRIVQGIMIDTFVFMVLIFIYRFK